MAIDEKKLLADLNNLLFTTEMNSVASKTIEQCIECVDNQPQVVCSRREWYQKGYQDGLNADKWISCSERLPKKKGYYICTVYRYEDDEHNVFDLWFENGKWYVDEVNDCEEYRRSKIFIHEVIAWQSLPEPYKKEGAE